MKGKIINFKDRSSDYLSYCFFQKRVPLKGQTVSWKPSVFCFFFFFLRNLKICVNLLHIHTDYIFLDAVL